MNDKPKTTPDALTELREACIELGNTLQKATLETGCLDTYLEIVKATGWRVGQSKFQRRVAKRNIPSNE